jgi:hypothetical protein
MLPADSDFAYGAAWTNFSGIYGPSTSKSSSYNFLLRPLPSSSANLLRPAHF